MDTRPDRTTGDRDMPSGPTSQPESAKALLGAIDEMELLLSHATQAGKVIPVKRIQALIEAQRAARNGEITAETEIKFWHEFQELGQQLKPISVDSLKATSKDQGPLRPHRFFGPPKKQSLADLAVRRYQIWSVIALVLLLVTQIYTIFGSKAVSDIQLLDTEIAAEQLKINDLSRSADEAAPEERSRMLAQIRESDVRLQRMIDRWMASNQMLATWLPLRFGDLYTQTGNLDTQTRLQIAQIILESLSKYVLPLLYGLLGACAYVLRTLSQEIKDLVYTVESDIRFKLRIYLGTLAGLAIGWLITEQSTPVVLQSVTPMALAFLAGYSVELLFSAMDTVIGAFTKASRKSPNGQ